MTGNLRPLQAISPNRIAPVVRRSPDGVRELVMMRWGFPLVSVGVRKPRNSYLTHVEITDHRYWQNYLTKPEARCLIPVTSFSELDKNRAPWSNYAWFARDESRPLMFFAGIWREWEGNRGTKDNPEIGRHMIFTLLTTQASPDVTPIHAEAMPVLLLDEKDLDLWMNASWENARRLQETPPAGVLRIVARNTIDDGVWV
jgi:putative SOS response-associated peptidase YedK